MEKNYTEMSLLILIKISEYLPGRRLEPSNLQPPVEGFRARLRALAARVLRALPPYRSARPRKFESI